MITFAQSAAQVLNQNITFSQMIDAEGVEFLVEDCGANSLEVAQLCLYVAKDASPEGAVMVTAKAFNAVGKTLGQCSHQFCPSILDCTLWQPAMTFDLDGETLVAKDTDQNVIRIMIDALEMSFDN